MLLINNYRVERADYNINNI